MPLEPSFRESLARASADLRLGLPIVLGGGGALILCAAAETLGAARLGAMRALGSPLVVVTAQRAATLKARAYDGDLARIEMPVDAGIDWVHGVTDPADDFASPMKGPFRTLRGGEVDHYRAALALAKRARLLPAVVALPVTAAQAAANSQLVHLDFNGPIDVMAGAEEVQQVVHARVPLAVARESRLHVFRTADGDDEHYAIEIGRPDRSRPVLARLHSACFTGDLLGSLKCDCGAQLKAALEAMAAEGAGVMLYLNQEGRGIGLANKMRAYSLQDQGLDTVEANHRLGFEDDERDFRVGARILQRMGFSAVRLLSNNPAKVAMMQANGIEVTERVPLRVGRHADNEAYLRTKAEKSGHIL